MRQSLGDYCKSLEEKYTSYRVDPGESPFLAIRIDGKKFSKFTKNFKKPYSENLANSLDKAALATAKEIGACAIYSQSDEITFLCAASGNEFFEYYCGGKLHKMNSIIASIFTSNFALDYNKAYFDCRVFGIHEYADAERIFLWRYLDCYKNGITGIAQLHYSHSELNDKNTQDRIQMILEAGDVLSNYSDDYLYGRFYHHDCVLVNDIYRSKMLKTCRARFDYLPPRKNAGSLNGGVPNNFDHNKRGFEPK